MFFKQFYNDHLSHASYLIGCQRTNEALIVDPNKDLQQYIDVANKEGFTITQAVETHIHADYASGIRDVAKLLNAHIHVSKEGDNSLGYKNMPDNTHFVGHDDIIKVGHIELKVLHTPGHTPESISFLLTDIGGGSSVPMGIFTGDFLFVGDIGRPDLLEKAVSVEGSTEIGAKAMFKSIQQKTYQIISKYGLVMVPVVHVVKHSVPFQCLHLATNERTTGHLKSQMNHNLSMR